MRQRQEEARVRVPSAPAGKSQATPSKAPPPPLEFADNRDYNPFHEVVPFRILERGDFVSLANRQYDNLQVAIIDVGYANATTTAEREVLVKSVIRSVTNAWTMATTDREKFRDLEVLEQTWTKDFMETPDSVKYHTAPIAVAQFTALGIMVKTLPNDMQLQFDGSFFWSEQNNILDTWHSVARNMARRGATHVYSRRQEIVVT